MQQGNGQFVLPYTAHQVAASSGELHMQEMGEQAGLPRTFSCRTLQCCWHAFFVSCPDPMLS